MAAEAMLSIHEAAAQISTKSLTCHLSLPENAASHTFPCPVFTSNHRLDEESMGLSQVSYELQTNDWKSLSIDDIESLNMAQEREAMEASGFSKILVMKYFG